MQRYLTGSSEEVLDKTGAAEDSSVGINGKERTQQQRSNTTVHVCWHRNTSISTRDHLLALEVFIFLFNFFHFLIGLWGT
jgi:FERM/RhoGEF/pleckstrin domain protein 2